MQEGIWDVQGHPRSMILIRT